MTRYRIVEWDERYEVDEKGGVWSPDKPKRSGPLKYIRHKVHGRSQGLGWRRLIQVAGIRGAPGIFGIFAKLLEISGDAKCQDRGFFDDDTECQLSFILGLHDDDVKNAISVLCEIGWVSVVDDVLGNPRKSAEIRGNPNQFSSVQDNNITTTARARTREAMGESLSALLALWNRNCAQKHMISETTPAIDRAYSGLVHGTPPISHDEIAGAIENYGGARRLQDSQAGEFSLGRFLLALNDPKGTGKYLTGIFNLDNFSKSHFRKEVSHRDSNRDISQSSGVGISIENP